MNGRFFSVDFRYVLCAGLVAGKRVFRLGLADELSPDLQRIAVFRWIHSRCKAVGLQEVLGTYFWPWLFMSCLKLGVFSCRIETLCKYANLHIIFYGKLNCFISVVSFHFSGVLNLLFQDSKSAFFFYVIVMLHFFWSILLYHNSPCLMLQISYRNV